MSSLPGFSGLKARGQTSESRPNRQLRSAMLHAPATLRALVRADEIWLVVLAAIVGIGAGLVVVAMNLIVAFVHHDFFQVPYGQRLSGMARIAVSRALLVPVGGGLLLGISGLVLTRWWPRRVIDPIEANALYGGHMSLVDSIVLVVQTLVSNGSGASVGLEAGYSQIGGAIASKLGRSFRLRRNDLRVMVGCGAGAAIGAAFNAPLTGAFYGFELVIGTYSLVTLAPVVISSICAVVVQRLLLPDADTRYDILLPVSIRPLDYLPILALGMLCALTGIIIMRGVTLTESIFQRSGVPTWLRPMIGGSLLGVMALITPAVLSGGHEALKIWLDNASPIAVVALMLALKATASAVSIGSGFRGGLFFASLFLGTLLGKLFGDTLMLLTPADALPVGLCAMIGMSGLAVAIVGGPLTMTFLALESTGSLPITIAVLAAAVISSLTVRRTFGYSFATWRFHLRGETIRSAVDIGWMRSLTVGRMMRREQRTMRADTPLAACRREYPLGAAQRVIAVDEQGRYAGIAHVSELHSAPESAERLSEVLHCPKTVLLPQMSIKEAVSLFESAEADALAVVDAPQSMKVIGLLAEQHALRRYSEELDRQRRDLAGG